MKNIKPFLLVLLALVMVSACATPKKRKSVAKKSAADTAADSAYTPDVNVEEANLRGTEFQQVDGLTAIFFDYDSASLKGPQLETLKKNADYLKGQKGLEVLIAGYCDDRGTIEYNLALGQKRAKEVREYYIRLGVPGKSLATISYGKESPTCSDASETCWAANRRAETRIRMNTASNGGATKKVAQ
jgi:peptidoglycan-associated lipoprotein